MTQKKATIIGAGLVGSLQACYLQKRGYKVDVYESRGDMRKVGYIGGRSINLALSTRGWTALEKIGLADEIHKIAIPMYGRTIHGIDGSINYQPYGKENQAIYSVSRGELNKRMVELADSFLEVDFHFDHFCQNVDFKNNRITFHQSETNQDVELNSDFILASDGAFSRVRLAMQAMPRFQYSQYYIDYGYKELFIPAGPNGEFLLDKNSLHIWPRGEFMMIALPNLDGSFTCTLFLPFEGELAFDDLNNEVQVKTYFDTYFPDAVKLMPTLIQDFFKNPTSALVTVRCFPWHHENAVLLGDAAHAVVPFFGQGMNCGFEDVRIFDELLDKFEDKKQLFEEYSNLRKENGDAIAQMALDNFIEMRDKVGIPEFLEMKHIEHEIMENPIYNYTSMYQYVSFSNEPYSFAYKLGKKQYAMLEAMAKDKDIYQKIKDNQIKDYFDKYLV
ncbi:MAG: FAD-dependent oxidoreductase [Chitinophagales bacterium]|jgi:kynurenine 3-monooxygenase|nr:FAD-dependent monooxygenase [Sphingobacteriales bacterium]